MLQSDEKCVKMYDPLLLGFNMNLKVFAANSNVILTIFSSLAALEVVEMTTWSADDDENFVKMTFPF